MSQFKISPSLNVKEVLLHSFNGISLVNARTMFAYRPERDRLDRRFTGGIVGIAMLQLRKRCLPRRVSHCDIRTKVRAAPHVAATVTIRTNPLNLACCEHLTAFRTPNGDAPVTSTREMATILSAKVRT